MGFRHFKNLCKVFSPSPASPLFQRKPCLLQLLQLKKRQSTKSRTWYEIRAISSAVAEHSLPPCKHATLEDTVITNVGKKCSSVSPHAKYAFSLTLTILNFDLQFACLALCLCGKNTVQIISSVLPPPHPCP